VRTVRTQQDDQDIARFGDVNCEAIILKKRQFRAAQILTEPGWHRSQSRLPMKVPGRQRTTRESHAESRDQRGPDPRRRLHRDVRRLAFATQSPDHQENRDNIDQQGTALGRLATEATTILISPPCPRRHHGKSGKQHQRESASDWAGNNRDDAGSKQFKSHNRRHRPG
jgi:hypothetical protein